MQLPRTPTMRLDGRRALVTGAGRGLGMASAAALAEAGAEVLLVARNGEQVESVAAAIRETGGKADSAVLDVTDVGAVQALVGARGPFAILVNNAGSNRPALLQDVTEADYDAIANVNVRAPLFVSKAVAGGLIEAGLPGSIIHMSSQMGHVGGRERSVYCATKHALEGMCKAMAWELGRHGIRVNTLCPTFIETPLTRPFFEDPAFRREVESKIALGHLGRLEDVMGAVVFLASDAASLITGSALMVDGGWTAA